MISNFSYKGVILMRYLLIALYLLGFIIQLFPTILSDYIGFTGRLIVVLGGCLLSIVSATIYFLVRRKR